jgi:hypothetical protein
MFGLSFKQPKLDFVQVQFAGEMRVLLTFPGRNGFAKTALRRVRNTLTLNRLGK